MIDPYAECPHGVLYVRGDSPATECRACGQDPHVAMLGAHNASLREKLDQAERERDRWYDMADAAGDALPEGYWTDAEHGLAEQVEAMAAALAAARKDAEEAREERDEVAGQMDDLVQDLPEYVHVHPSGESEEQNAYERVCSMIRENAALRAELADLREAAEAAVHTEHHRDADHSMNKRIGMEESE